MSTETTLAPLAQAESLESRMKACLDLIRDKCPDAESPSICFEIGGTLSKEFWASAFGEYGGGQTPEEATQILLAKVGDMASRHEAKVEKIRAEAKKLGLRVTVESEVAA